MKTRLFITSFTVLFLLFPAFNVFAQTLSDKLMPGRVLDEQLRPIELVQVTLIDSVGKLIKFTYTDDQGLFSLPIPNGIRGSLSFSRLGYQKKLIALENWDTNPVVLSPSQSTLLREVTVQDKVLVEETRDTISYVTDRVRDGTESKLEDVLKKLPGITVNQADGKILYQGKEITALLLDGDNLTGDNYRMLSKGLSAEWLDEVQVLKRFTGNKLLQGIKPSDEVALNIRLKENFKSPLFGKASAGVGTWQRALLQKELLRYSPKNKGFWVTDASNLGESLEVMDLETYQQRNAAFMGFVRPSRFTEGPANLPGIINESNFNFQRGIYTNPNIIFRPSEKSSIKSNTSLTIRTRDFSNSDSSFFFTEEGEGFSLVQDVNQVTDYKSFFQDLSWVKEYESNQQLELLSRFSYHSDNSGSLFSNTFRDQVQQDELEKLSLLVGSKYTLRLKDKSALDLQFHAENQRSTENLVFGESNLTTSATNQTLKQENTNLAFHSEYLKKWTEKLFSQISIHLIQSAQKANVNTSHEVDEYFSKKREGVFGINLASKWKNIDLWAGSKIRLGGVSWDSLTRNFLLIEPSIKLSHTIQSKNFWNLTNRFAYQRDNSIPTIYDWIPITYNPSFRQTITNSINPAIFTVNDLSLWSFELKKSTLDFFMINGELLFQNTLNPIFSKFFYTEDLVREVRKNGGRQEELSANISVSKYLSALSILVKTNFSSTRTSLPLGIEGRLATGENIADKVTISTGFVGLNQVKFSFGYHFNRLKNNWDQEKEIFYFQNFNASVNWTPKPLTSVKILYEGLHLDQKRNQISSVLSLESGIKPKKDSKWEYKLKWNNVLNQQNLSLIQIAPGISSQSSFPMLRSFLLVQASFGF